MGRPKRKLPARRFVSKIKAVGNLQDILERALAEHRAGRIAAAEQVYRDLVAEDSDFHPAWHLLGVALLQQGRAAEAVHALQRAATLNPSEAKYQNNLGGALSALSRAEDALSAFEQAAALAPGYAEPIYNAGVVHQNAGRMVEAEEAYRRALAVAPDHAGAHNNLGAVFQEQGRLDDALRHFEAAAAIEATNSEALRNIASLHEMSGDRDAAREAIGRAMVKAPSSSFTIKNALLLPVVYADKADLDDSRQVFAKGLKELLASPLAIKDPVLEGARGPFFLAYQGQNDRHLAEQLADIYRRACPLLVFTAPHCLRSRRRTGRLRIGFLSRYFSNHTIGKLNRGLIARLPRGRFEVYVFSIGNAADELAKEIQVSADVFVRLDSNLKGAAQRIADMELDVLHYTDLGMDPFSYFLAFMRLAPIQTMSWGHPVTSGLGTIDHFISWDAAETEEADDHYTERLTRFSRMVSYYPRPAPVPPIDRGSMGWKAGRRVYFCAQTLFKIHPDMDLAFRGIIERDPEAQIVLIANTGARAREGLLTRWRKQGIEDSFAFVPRMTNERYRQMLGAADVVIDSFPFSGGNSSLDAFADGVPIVTLPGEYLRGRVTAAMYKQMAIDECTARSVADYADKAVLMARSPDMHRNLSLKIAERNAELFDDQRVIKEFADFFERVADEHR